MTTTRRTALTTLAAAAVGLPVLGDLAGTTATAAAAETTDRFGSNTELYASTAYTEGEHWVRRFRRAGLLDNLRDTSPAVPLTAVIAPHGGAIEEGTSELCLAIAGYELAGAAGKEAAPPPAPLGGGIPARDYWMFEALVNAPNNDLHVTATHCDDPAALAVTGGSKYAVSLHGSGAAGLEVLIGGRDQRLMRNLRGVLRNRSFTDPARPVSVRMAGADSPINGDDPRNIANRTHSGAGAQLELSFGLRSAMFGAFGTAGERRASAGLGTDPAYYWNGFVNGVRTAVDRNERGLDWPLHEAVPHDG